MRGGSGPEGPTAGMPPGRCGEGACAARVGCGAEVLRSGPGHRGVVTGAGGSQRVDEDHERRELAEEDGGSDHAERGVEVFLRIEEHQRRERGELRQNSSGGVGDGAEDEGCARKRDGRPEERGRL